MNENKVNHDIDAVQVLGMLLRGWWIILIAVVIFTGAAIGYTQVCTTPTYQSSATLLLNGDSAGVSNITQQILAGQYQSKDYPYILKANDTMVEAAKKLNEAVGSEKYTAGAVASMVRGESIEDSRIFQITVSCGDAEEARLVAEKVTEAFKERAQTLTDIEVGIVDNPQSGSASKPPMSRNAILGLVVGLLIGAVISVIIGLTNDAVDSEEWLINKYKDKIPLLSTIPDASSGRRSAYYRYKYKYSRNYASVDNNNDK